MERLTFEGNFCDIAQCRNVPGGSFCENGSCAQKQVWERLKQFEDATQTPENFYKMYSEFCLLESALKTYGNHYRMKELAEADKEGRVAILPCKNWLDIVFGEQDTFYHIDTDYTEEPIREISVDNAERISWYDGWKTVYLKCTDENGQYLEFTPDDFGKTVFLTREEAEKALAEMEGKKDG